jgi:putative sigma-54 modulation protein
MELQITGKNIEISPEVRQYIERKLDKLGRHLHKIMESKVEISEQKTKSPQQHFVVQVTIDSNGTLFRSQERGENLVSAIDRVVEIMDRQIKRYKGKLYKKGRGSSLAKGGLSEEIVEEKTMGRIVKIKQFVVKPMSVDEAIEQMELLGHDFFLFFDADDERLNLLYRRKDGDYGLIKPELG